MTKASTVPPDVFRPVRHAAFRLRVPPAWLAAEAKANRVPHLRVGRRIYVNAGLLAGFLDLRAHSATDFPGGPGDQEGANDGR
jgi:hypothetical protein